MVLKSRTERTNDFTDVPLWKDKTHQEFYQNSYWSMSWTFCLSLHVKGTKQKPPSCWIFKDDYSPVIETEGVEKLNLSWMSLDKNINVFRLNAKIHFRGSTDEFNVNTKTKCELIPGLYDCNSSYWDNK